MTGRAYFAIILGMKIKYSSLAITRFRGISTFFAASLISAAAFGDSVIVDDRPAQESERAWESQRYPIGNGRLGAMLTGGVSRESVQFNVDSLWTGGENLSGAVNDRESAATDGGVGNYQNFGELVVDLGLQGTTSSYVRRLDLATAVHAVEYVVDRGNDGLVRVSREAFASAPADVMAFRFTASAPFSPKIELKGAHGETPVSLGGNSIGFTGRLDNGLAYAARADWNLEGGTNLVVWLRAKTSYDLRRDDFGLGRACEQYGKPFRGDFAALRGAHVADYCGFYRRMALKISGAEPQKWKEMPTRERLAYYRKGVAAEGMPSIEEAFRDLAETQFNLGRYLLISSSRPGALPANLQGLWNNRNNPPWHSDYHTNINLQMNYWGVDVANMSEMWSPVADWLTAANRTAAKETRLAFPNSKGIAYRTSLNAFGGGGWKWNYAGAPWMAVMAYDHYLFTGDKKYLRDVAWPQMHDSLEFMYTHLVEGPSGELLVKQGWSPEHGPVQDGVMHDQQLLRELLVAYIDAAKVLGKNSTRAADTLKRLGGNKIGSWGQLQEWQEDIDKKHDEHRHTSHLFAVYPGTTITRSATPEFAAAAEVSLSIGRTATNDSRRSWTWPWRAALWARLGNGDKSGEMLEGLLKYNTLDNLFATHPPFQIDGNLGLVAAVCEMLVESHEKTSDGKTLVRLLPGLPSTWPNGVVRGLKVRGGATVDIEWKDGKLRNYKTHGGNGRIKVVDETSSK